MVKSNTHTDFLQSHKKEFFAKKKVRDLKKKIKTLQIDIQNKRHKRWLRSEVNYMEKQLDIHNKELADILSGTYVSEYESLVDKYSKAKLVTRHGETELVGETSKVYNKHAIERELREQIDQKFKCKRK